MISKRANFFSFSRVRPVKGGTKAFICLFFVLAALCSTAGSLYAAEPPFQLPPPSELSKLKSAVISTNKGDMYFELYPEDAPWHVANFKFLADQGFYRGSRFHIFYENYIIQGGGPRGKPEGSPGYSLPAEFNQHHHEFGALGGSRAPNEINPERRSSGSQFHILLLEAGKMDGAYTVFGKLTKGKVVLESLRKDDVIKDVKVYVRVKP